MQNPFAEGETQLSLARLIAALDQQGMDHQQMAPDDFSDNIQCTLDRYAIVFKVGRALPGDLKVLLIWFDLHSREKADKLLGLCNRQNGRGRYSFYVQEYDNDQLGIAALRVTDCGEVVSDAEIDLIVTRATDALETAQKEFAEALGTPG